MSIQQSKMYYIISKLTSTQCAMDCGPQNVLQIWACMQIPLCCVVFTWFKLYFNICALIFYVCEGSKQPTANQLNIQNIMPQSLTHIVEVSLSK